MNSIFIRGVFGLMVAFGLAGSAFADPASVSGIDVGVLTLIENEKLKWQYDGYVSDGTTVVGIASLSVTGTAGKPKLKAKVSLNGKNVSLTASTWADNEEGCKDVSFGGKASLAVKIGDLMAAGVLDGNYYVYLARNRATGNDLSSVSAYAGDYLVRIDDRDGRIGYLQITAKAKKGAVTIKGMLPDGEEVSCKSTMLLFDDSGDGGVYIPVYAFKKGKWTFGTVLKIEPDDFNVIPEGEGATPIWTSVKPLSFSQEIGVEGMRLGKLSDRSMWLSLMNSPQYYVSKLEESIDPADGLPDGIEIAISGGKLIVPEKATTPRRVSEDGYTYYEYNGPTDAGLKLSYNAKTGMLKGSFKLYYDWEEEVGEDRIKFNHKTVTAKMQGFAYGSGFVGFYTVPQTDPNLKKTQKTISCGFEIQ